MPLMQRLSRCVMPAAVLLTALLAPAAFADTNPTNSAGTSPGLQGPWTGKDFDDLDGAELDAAKQAALSAHFRTLRVCADPGNMPLSDRAQEGYENKILDVLAKAMGARLSYFWRSYDGDIVGQAFGTADECDILIDMPDHDQDLLSTVPIYRTTYVLVWRTNENLAIKSLDDARLKQLRVGVFQISALREALANHGVRTNVQLWPVASDTEWVPAHQPWRQVEQVVDGKLDIAAAWGPMAGWLKTMKGAPVTIQPTNLMDSNVPMEFSLGHGRAETGCGAEVRARRRPQGEPSRDRRHSQEVWRAAGAVRRLCRPGQPCRARQLHDAVRGPDREQADTLVGFARAGRRVAGGRVERQQ